MAFKIIDFVVCILEKGRFFKYCYVTNSNTMNELFHFFCDVFGHLKRVHGFVHVIFASVAEFLTDF